MKKLLLVVLALMFIIVGCSQKEVSINLEDYNSAYETSGVLLRLCREHLIIDRDKKAIQLYNGAVDLAVMAGNILAGYIKNPKQTDIANFPIRLEQIVVIVTEIFGEKLMPNTGKYMGPIYLPGTRVIIDRDKSVCPEAIIATLNILLKNIDKICGPQEHSVYVLTSALQKGYLDRIEATKSRFQNIIIKKEKK